MPHELSHHKPRMLASFVNHLIGVLDDPDQAQAAVQAILQQEGLQEHDIELLVGQEGELRLDFTGERHGLLARLRREIQGLTDEYTYARRYELELGRGHVLILIATRHEEQAQRICHLLRGYGGHFIHYYGPLIVESFCPDPEAE
ncbi:hypothetical protein Dxin01_03593 [Deinococcus xinjiangensis]|uniref:Uncharacterized protein n=1 Tax=Deinococcus xinjiangensis TaxID=457454 RepID=A0ABP9VGX3_9DEIO